MDNEKSMLSRILVCIETRSREEARIHGKKKGFATVQLSTTEFFGERNPDKKEAFKKEIQPTCFAFTQGDRPRGNARDYWHPAECSFHHTGNCKHVSKCAFKHAEKTGSEPEKQHDSVTVAKTLDDILCFDFTNGFDVDAFASSIFAK